jgi:outer membrane protein
MAPTLSRLAIAVIAALAALPGASQAMDLAQAYRDALAYDAQVASARASLSAVREREQQARAGLLPASNLSATLNRAGVDTNLADRREFTQKIFSANLSYPLYRLQNIETFEQSKLQVAVSEAALVQTHVDLAIRVSQAYFDVLAAQDNLRTIQSQKRAITEQLASAKRNFEVGTATITDQQEAQARFDLSVAQESSAINDLLVRRSALALLIGKPVTELKVLRTGVELQPPTPAREAEWTDSARQNNLAVQQARVAAEIAKREIDKQRYGHYPTLDVIGSVGWSQNGNTATVVNLPGVQSYNASIGLQLNLPIYAGGGIDARVREARALLDKSQSDLETARRAAEQGARQTFIGVNSGLAQVRALEAAEKSSQLALDSNLLGYQVGVRINIDVLNAQQQLFTTRRDLAKARYDVLMNGLKLKQTAGTLSEEDLQAIGALLETAPAGGDDVGAAAPAPAAPPAAPVAPARR